MAAERRDRDIPGSTTSVPDGPFSVGEFRAIWLAYAQSVVGDQLARVALSVLVFARTGSPGWTAATYALTMLPALVSGVLLAGLADRFPRRTVAVTCDLVRAAVLGLMALPAMPLPLLAGLLVLAQLAEAPFGAAQGAMLPMVLGERRYEQGQRILLITHQAGQLVGFAGGGLLVVALGTHLSLAADAATFLLSAVLLRAGVRVRPAAGATSSGARPRLHARAGEGARLIWSDRRLRTLVSLGWLAGFFVVPEGLAAPFAKEVGAGTPAVGLLLSACPAGMVLGAYLLGRDWVGMHQRLRLLGPLAVGTSLPLVLFVFGPGLIVALILLGIAGFCAAFQITAGATFVRLTPDHQRGQALGLARSGLVAAQGIGVAAGGVVAEVTGTASGTIGAAGVAGTLCAIAAATAWSRVGPDRIVAVLEQATATPAAPVGPA